MANWKCNSLFVLCIIVELCNSNLMAVTVPTTSPTPNGNSTTSTSTTAASGTPAEVTPLKITASKRDIKPKDLPSRYSIAAAKSYDPPPEFYRGPGSTNSGSSSSSNRDSSSAAFISKPNTYTGVNGRSKYGPTDNSGYLANSYNNWQLSRPPPSVGSGSYGIQDRISVGHYGNPQRGGGTSAATGYISSSSTGTGSYGYEGRPYGATHAVEYVPAHEHYASGGSAYQHHHQHQSSAASAEGIQYDLYSHGNGAYGTRGHYAGAGGEYSYTYPDENETAAHKEPSDYSRKALLAKSFLIPLASAAVLGIAAALVSNPLLLQLGTVSGGVVPGVVGPAVVGKRRRRDLHISRKSSAGRYDSGDELAYHAHKRDLRYSETLKHDDE